MAGVNRPGVRSTVTSPGHPGAGRRRILTGPAVRLLRDETAVTTVEYVVAAVALVLAALAAARMLTGVLIPYLHRIYLVVTLPVP